ncbi:DUF4129 domain-containing protein [Flavobacterium sp.]|uniref:DUF4129 domain-containing protein n=1 Tax=Flavobacterium sp. TaxID=239 RepID=UPI0040349E4A
MNKILIYIFLICAPFTVATATVQDSIVFKEVKALPVNEVKHKERNFKEGFKDDYTGSEYQYEPKVEQNKTALDRFFEWVAMWLERLFAPSPNSGKMSAMGIFGRVVAFLLLGVAVYFIARAILNKQGYWIFGRASKKINAYDVDDEDLNEMDFASLISETRQSGNYRLAVRYYYLWLLKKLSAREVIQLHRDKTNSDYLYEIRDKGLKDEFRYLSYVYDHSWYGEFSLDEAAFEKAERAFRKTINVL